MKPDGTVVITELPIKKWAEDYTKWLEMLTEEKKISGHYSQSIDNKIYFEIYGFKDAPTHKSLKLQKTMGMSNMVLLDDDNKPVEI